MHFLYSSGVFNQIFEQFTICFLQLSFNITFNISNLFNTQNISNSIHVYQRKIASNHLIYGHIVNKTVMKTVFSFVTLDFLHFTYKILNNIDFVSGIHA